MRDVLASHETLRKSLTSYPRMKDNDLTWRRTWPPSALTAMDFMEAITSHDPLLHDAEVSLFSFWMYYTCNRFVWVKIQVGFMLHSRCI